METQDYAFEPGLTVGELLKSSQKDWQAAINAVYRPWQTPKLH